MKGEKAIGSVTDKKAKNRASGKRRSKPFPIVAIGASAGGLEAISLFLKSLPSVTGMAYVYIQHLDPLHESKLSEILSRQTRMTVIEAKNLMPIKKDNLFIIPPNKDMAIIDGVLTLNPRAAKPSIHLPIDKFFLSLAEKQKDGAIGIVLSGNANDGTLGLKAIKAAGGFTFAQDESAKFQSMPKSAIAEGVVDMVLPPDKIAKELARISNNKDFLTQVFSEDASEQVGLEDLIAVLDLLKKSTGVDFGNYKLNTIQRRVLRRVLLHKFETLKDYLKYLRQNTSEINSLYQDLLINVTAFFRDPDALEYLKKTILPKIINSKKGNDPIRIWVPACSSGEEAYSLAMLLTEIIGDNLTTASIQIFASDLSDFAIAKARIGLYSKNDLSGVSPKRLQRFFTKVDGSYRIVKSIRDLCVFAPHNILRDPPFSRLDLISCCNVMIYFESSLQKKILHTFHYALNENGYLVLGKSESVSSAAELFHQTERKYKVYSKKNDVPNKAKFELRFPIPERGKPGEISKPAVSRQQRISRASELENVIDVMLQRHSPPGVVINGDMEIIQFRGSTSLFLEPASGKASFNLLKMARPGLSFELRNAVHKASKSGNIVKRTGIEIKLKGVIHLVSFEVEPVKLDGADKLFLIIFHESFFESASSTRTSVPQNKVIQQLEHELEVIREDMRSLLEEQEAQVEELQSSNEEVVSSNEELQSINEELETSKEEIESANEELSTINSELETRNNQLSESYEYAESVFSIICEAVVVLDKDFRVRNANKAFYNIFKVKEQQTEGLLLFELGNRQWDIHKLRQLLEDVVQNKSSFSGFEVDHDFPGVGHRVMRVNAQGIVRDANQEHLILVAIEDITEHRKAAKLVAEREAWFRTMANQAPVMIWVSGDDGSKTFFNETWINFTGAKISDEKAWDWKEQIHREDLAGYLKTFKNALARRELFRIEYRLKRADGSFRWVLEIARPTQTEDGKFNGFIGSCTEIHEKKVQHDVLEQMIIQRTSDLQKANTELHRSNSELKQFAYGASHDLQEPLRKILTFSERLKKIENELPPSGNDLVNKIVDSSQRMRKLIDGLLEFSKADLKDQQFLNTNLSDILQAVISDFELIIAEKKVTINADALPSIEAIPIQMDQLLHNLLGNAIKFSKRDVPSVINIATKKLSKEEIAKHELDVSIPHVGIAISDNGIDFEQEYAERIFGIFQRLNDKQEFPGTGIGLALCRKIVTTHQGKIFAESVPDGGSTFNIVLPVQQSSITAID
ncbi:MAG TPA: CheR family methyltransferase [Cyclobacteriaceae bacterium]|nr:CheR family methyltransferase [Cyclobacteriaceae bacterium]